MSSTLDSWEAEAKKPTRKIQGLDFDKIDVLMDELEQGGRFKQHPRVLDILDLASYGMGSKQKIRLLIELVRAKDSKIKNAVECLDMGKIEKFSINPDSFIHEDLREALALTDKLS